MGKRIFAELILRGYSKATPNEETGVYPPPPQEFIECNAWVKVYGATNLLQKDCSVPNGAYTFDSLNTTMNEAREHPITQLPDNFSFKIDVEGVSVRGSQGGRYVASWGIGFGAFSGAKPDYSNGFITDGIEVLFYAVTNGGTQLYLRRIEAGAVVESVNTGVNVPYDSVVTITVEFKKNGNNYDIYINGALMASFQQNQNTKLTLFYDDGWGGTYFKVYDITGA